MASAETSVSAKTGSGGGPQKKKFGLVLQGAAAFGAYEAGAIKCLYDRGMECTIVAGASSGALNAVALAAAESNPAANIHPQDALVAMWKRFAPDAHHPAPFPTNVIDVPNMYRPRRDVWNFWNFIHWTYMADNTPVKEMLERLDWGQVRNPDHMRVFVSASDIESGKTVYFSNLPPKKLPGPEYPAVRFGVEHAIASGSFPGGFPWTVIDNRIYWDGGVTDNTPIHPVIDNLTKPEAETMPIYVIDVYAGAGHKPTNPWEVMLRFVEMLMQNNLETDTHRAESYERFISLLKDVDKILEGEKAKKILDELKKPTTTLPPEFADDLKGFLEELLLVKRKRDWGKAMDYYHVQHVHAVDIQKTGTDLAADFTKKTIERRLEQGWQQMYNYLESHPCACNP